MQSVKPSLCTEVKTLDLFSYMNSLQHSRKLSVLGQVGAYGSEVFLLHRSFKHSNLSLNTALAITVGSRESRSSRSCSRHTKTNSMYSHLHVEGKKLSKLRDCVRRGKLRGTLRPCKGGTVSNVLQHSGIAAVGNSLDSPLASRQEFG